MTEAGGDFLEGTRRLQEAIEAAQVQRATAPPPVEKPSQTSQYIDGHAFRPVHPFGNQYTPEKIAQREAEERRLAAIWEDIGAGAVLLSSQLAQDNEKKLLAPDFAIVQRRKHNAALLASGWRVMPFYTPHINEHYVDNPNNNATDKSTASYRIHIPESPSICRGFFLDRNGLQAYKASPADQASKGGVTTVITEQGTNNDTITIEPARFEDIVEMQVKPEDLRAKLRERLIAYYRIEENGALTLRSQQQAR